MAEEQVLACSDGGVVAAAMVASGHLALAVSTKTSSRIQLWDPVARCVAADVSLPQMPKAVRLTGVEAATADSGAALLIVARSDGEVTRVALPAAPRVDVGLVSVSELSAQLQGLSRPLHVDAPALLLEISADEGAQHSALVPLQSAWSAEAQQLAIVNTHSQLLVFSAEPGARCVQRNQLARAPCTFLGWSPATGTTLALALRGNGVGIWTSGSAADVKMWTGMSGGAGLIKADVKTFDPTSACWSRAGQLAIGMGDGSFAVWDSVSTLVSSSGRSGKHKGAITAAGWISSLFAPALALASRDTIKISTGFESAEWGATAIKLKLRRESSGDVAPSASPLRKLSSSGFNPMRKARTDPEGLEFVSLTFSLSGKYLAVLAFVASEPAATQVVVYEVQDSRESLVAVREYTGSEEEGAPFGMGWVGEEEALVVFARSRGGGCVRSLVLKGGVDEEPCWPGPGHSAPGRMTGAACSPAGLVAAAFDTGGGGAVVLLGHARLDVLSTFALSGVPRTLALHQPPLGSEGNHTLCVSFDEGGVQVWRL